MTRTAVFVIDMLNDCFGHDALAKLRNSLCISINTLTFAARKSGLPVIWVRQEFAEDLNDAFLDMQKKNIKMFI